MVQTNNSKAHTLTRRALLHGIGLGSASLLASAFLVTACQPAQAPQMRVAPAAAAQDASNDAFIPDVELKLIASPSEVAILPGQLTQVWRYQGEAIKGSPTVLQVLDNSYLGPMIHTRPGQKVRITFRNDLPEATIVHWHGLLVPPAADGHPQDLIEPGATYVYEFEVRNRPGTYWFHPHPHGRTGAQVTMGLAGLFLVHGEDETEHPLPAGEFDLPLVLQDRTFDAQNQFVYPPSTSSGSMGGMMQDMMTNMMGFLGEQILVNGQPSFTLPVATQAYRLRLLNGSNARIYKLAWSNGAPLTVIASDGGLLEKPSQRDYVMLAPSERVELWVDFSQQQVGDEIKLQSLAYTGVEAGMMEGMMDGMMPSAPLPNGAPFDILTVQVKRGVAATATLPAQLAKVERYQLADAINAANPRSFVLSMANMQWLINGRTFAMESVDDNEKVALGSLELWEFSNQQDAAGMSGMSHMGGMDHSKMGGNMSMGMMNDFMAHVMHIHGVQFQVLERQVDPAQLAGWSTINAGLIDEGWKDTVLVMPGERVKLLVKFDQYRGRYLVHCHNLEHEDMDMMLNYQII